MPGVRSVDDRFMLIGGGEIGRPGYPVQTLPIDKQLCAPADKPRPRLLFIPTASSDSGTYIAAVEQHFGRTLGCEVASLTILADAPTPAVMRRMVLDADIVYVGGGNTRRMLAAWLHAGLDLLLTEAAAMGKVLSGVSAGAICWCDKGISDSVGEASQWGIVGGLGLLPLTVRPHFRPHDPLDPTVVDTIVDAGGRTLCLTDCAALEVIGRRCRVLRSDTTAGAYLTSATAGGVKLEPVDVDRWLPLGDLR